MNLNDDFMNNWDKRWEDLQVVKEQIQHCVTHEDFGKEKEKNETDRANEMDSLESLINEGLVFNSAMAEGLFGAINRINLSIKRNLLVVFIIGFLFGASLFPVIKYIF